VASEYGGAAVVCTEGSSVTIDNCFFSGNTATDSGGGVACYGSEPTIKNSVFIGNSAVNGGGGAIFSGFGAWPQILQCTMVGNSADFGAGVMCYETSFATVERSIIAFSTTGNAAFCLNASGIAFSCSDIFGNPEGDWIGCIASQMGVDGNLSEDPLFCDLAVNNLTLAESSPCAPDNSPGSCGLIGAMPVGCGTASIDAGRAPALEALLRVSPNPLRSGGVIEWSNAQPATVTLRMYDSMGRQVLSQNLGVLGAGPHAAQWNDIPESWTLPSAVYYLELSGASSRPSAVRVILTR
jgi:predicted outer membrane repeat protein